MYRQMNLKDPPENKHWPILSESSIGMSSKNQSISSHATNDFESLDLQTKLMISQESLW